MPESLTDPNIGPARVSTNPTEIVEVHLGI